MRKSVILCLSTLFSICNFGATLYGSNLQEATKEEKEDILSLPSDLSSVSKRPSHSSKQEDLERKESTVEALLAALENLKAEREFYSQLSAKSRKLVEVCKRQCITIFKLTQDVESLNNRNAELVESTEFREESRGAKCRK